MLFRCCLLLLILFAPPPTPQASARWTSPTTAEITWLAPPSCEWVVISRDGYPMEPIPCAAGRVALGAASNQDFSARPCVCSYALEFLPKSHPGVDVVVSLDRPPPVSEVWLPGVWR